MLAQCQQPSQRLDFRCDQCIDDFCHLIVCNLIPARRLPLRDWCAGKLRESAIKHQTDRIATGSGGGRGFRDCSQYKFWPSFDASSGVLGRPGDDLWDDLGDPGCRKRRCFGEGGSLFWRSTLHSGTHPRLCCTRGVGLGGALRTVVPRHLRHGLGFGSFTSRISSISAVSTATSNIAATKPRRSG